MVQISTVSRYTDDEAHEILRRAMERGGDNEGRVHHEDLVEAAQEVGIDPRLVEQAAVELREEREVHQILEDKQDRKRSRFWRSVLTYLMVNALLLGIDIVAGGGFWFYWPLMIWGFFVALRGMRTYLPQSKIQKRKEFEKATHQLRKRKAKQAEAAEKKARNQRRKMLGKNVERTIEQGVGRLFEAAANRIEGKESPKAVSNAPSGDFSRYTAKQKQGKPPPAAKRAPPAKKAPPAPAKTAPVASKVGGKKVNVVVTPPPPKARVDVAQNPGEQDALEAEIAERLSRRRR